MGVVGVPQPELPTAVVPTHIQSSRLRHEGRVLSAARHRLDAFVGRQYHPGERAGTSLPFQIPLYVCVLARARACALADLGFRVQV